MPYPTLSAPAERERAWAFRSRLMTRVIQIAVANPILFAAFCWGQAQETFDLSTVIRMQRAGMSDDLIALAILNGKGAACSFDTSPHGLVVLKEAGFSEKLVGAIIQCPAAHRSGMPDSTAQPDRRVPYMVADGRVMALSFTTTAKVFAPGKKDDPMRSLGSLGNIGIDAATGAAAASAGLGSAIPLAGLGVAGWDLYRTRTVKGFSFEIVRGISSSNVVPATPAALVIPFESFQDARYSKAAPMLIRLTPSAETQARVVGTARAESKYSAMAGPKSKMPTVLDAYRHDFVQAEFVKSDKAFRVQTTGLTAGQYAVGFLMDGELVPMVLDFVVR